MNGFRLTLSSGNPIADATSTNTIYFTPYLHGRILLLQPGVGWTALTSSEVSGTFLGLSANKNYDVFAYNNSGVLTLELSAAWASDTVRTDSLSQTATPGGVGIYTKASDDSRRWIGTIRTTAGSTLADTTSQRFVWNYNNRVDRHMLAVDPTSSWTYVNPNSVWRVARATTANSFEYVTGDDTTLLNARVQGLIAINSASASDFGAVGIGVNSTSTNSAQTYGVNPVVSSFYMTAVAEYRDRPTNSGSRVGYHRISWLETGNSAAFTYTFAGRGGTTIAQTGLFGVIKC